MQEQQFRQRLCGAMQMEEHLCVITCRMYVNVKVTEMH